MRKLLVAILGAAVLAFPGRADAQASIGPTLAWHDDFDFGIGAMADVSVPAIAPEVGILADFTFFFPDADNVDYFEINGNLKWEFPNVEGPVSPFALGGLNFARVSRDDLDISDSEVGLNLGGGIEFNAGAFTPMVGGRFEIEGGEGFVLFGTLPFGLGG